MSRMPEGRIIGVGSPFGADRAGWEVVDYLQTAGFPERFPDLDWRILDRPGPRLIEWLAGMDLVVIIDALLGGVPGRPRIVDAAELAGNEANLSSHGFGVAEALAIAEALGDLPRQLAILAIEVGDGEQEVHYDYPAIADYLHRLLSDCGISSR